MGIATWMDPTVPPTEPPSPPVTVTVTIPGSPSVVTATVKVTDTVTSTPTAVTTTVTATATPSLTPAPKVTKTKVVYRTEVPAPQMSASPLNSFTQVAPTQDLQFPSVAPGPDTSQPQIVIQLPTVQPVSDEGPGAMLWAVLGLLVGGAIAVTVLVFVIRKVIKGKF